LALQLYLGSVIRERDDFRLHRLNIQAGNLDPYFRDGEWLDQVGRRLNLPPIVIDEADTLLRRLRASQKLKGRPGKKEACLFLACRLHEIRRTPEEIASFTNIRPFKIVRMAYEIAEELGVEIRQSNDTRILFRAIEVLRLPREYYTETLQIYSNLKNKNPNGRDPRSLFAAILYGLVKREGGHMTQVRVGSALDITEYTVRLAWGDVLSFIPAILSPRGAE
jgi:transcription initiation factor TFIIIB Brf1 subunit/transcription initiation factor TFIIB